MVAFTDRFRGPGAHPVRHHGQGEHRVREHQRHRRLAPAVHAHGKDRFPEGRRPADRRGTPRRAPIRGAEAARGDLPSAGARPRHHDYGRGHVRPGLCIGEDRSGRTGQRYEGEDFICHCAPAVHHRAMQGPPGLRRRPHRGAGQPRHAHGEERGLRQAPWSLDYPYVLPRAPTPGRAAAGRPVPGGSTGSPARGVPLKRRVQRV
mmetsp:Transcript_56137/g.122973  ORF Transcript_56137/g.122973 Transcript_56137/m.122973 type:complete len:205 (+) Transcript_56137:2287-2901(+)